MKKKGLRLTIPKRANSCFLDGDDLKPGQEYFSVLLPDLTEEIMRQDYCHVCWEKEEKKVCAHEKSTFWKAMVPTKKQKEELEASRSQNEKALELFLKLLEDEKEENNGMIFVLALYLERKRQIILRKEVEGCYCYEMPSTEEVVTVKKMNLAELSLQDLQEELTSELA